MAEFKLVTIGVYGSSEASFFQTLARAGVDTFVDIRRRRGVRGAQYAYANSTRLQQRLAQMGIRYIHMLTLAPTNEIRSLQNQADERLGVAKRARQAVNADFARAYQTQVLSPAALDEFLRQVGPDARVVALFCVERLPQACHRSILAHELEYRYHIPVEHLMP
jgi:uncharacterized protein (DUF488 family)